jgi:hypothetical protein
MNTLPVTGGTIGIEYGAISHHGHAVVRDMTGSHSVSSNEDGCIFLSKTLSVLPLTPPIEHRFPHQDPGKVYLAQPEAARSTDSWMTEFHEFILTR